MVKHNNAIPNQHFHKKWQRRVKTWLDQPAQKKIRRERRKLKAAAMAPRPAAGPLRPLVHAPTQKYNAKIKLGRGFSLAECKAAGVSPKYAQTVGIAVDHRRTNKCEESLTLNAARLKEYLGRLIVFPRKNNKVRKGDATKAERADAKQLVGEIVAAPKATDAVTFTKLTDEMKSFRAYDLLRGSRNTARLVGKREKALKSKKEEAPKKDAGADE